MVWLSVALSWCTHTTTPLSSSATLYTPPLVTPTNVTHLISNSPSCGWTDGLACGCRWAHEYIGDACGNGDCHGYHTIHHTTVLRCTDLSDATTTGVRRCTILLAPTPRIIPHYNHLRREHSLCTDGDADRFQPLSPPPNRCMPTINKRFNYSLKTLCLPHSQSHLQCQCPPPLMS